MLVSSSILGARGKEEKGGLREDAPNIRRPEGRRGRGGGKSAGGRGEGPGGLSPPVVSISLPVLWGGGGGS